MENEHRRPKFLVLSERMGKGETLEELEVNARLLIESQMEAIGGVQSV